MSFVHPGIAMVTAVLAALPLLIHLINRRRYRREPWAATMFLLRATRKSRRRMRLERILLLALRTAAICLIGLSVARPFGSNTPSAMAEAGASLDRVIVVDDSLSMQARGDDGASTFESAKRAALRIIDEAPAGGGFAVIGTARNTHSLMKQPVRDSSAARRIVETMQCTSDVPDYVGVLERAAEVLSRGSVVPGRRVVYVVSDLRHSSLVAPGGDVDTGSVPSGIDRVMLVDVGPEERGNLSLSNLRCVGQVIGAGIPVQVTFEVTNHGAGPVDDARVELLLDGRPLRALGLDPISAGGAVHPSFEMVFPSSGPHRLEATLSTNAPNVLSIDDTHRLAVYVRDHVPVLLVEGDSRPESTVAELFFYRTALDTRDGEDERPFFRTRTIAAGELEASVLDDYQVVVLGSVRRLSEKSWSRLIRYVQRGGGLILYLGRRIKRDHYERLAGREVEGGGLLPLELGEVIALDDEDAAAGRVQIADKNHPALIDFHGHDRGGLLLARVRRYWRPARQPDRSIDETDVQMVLRLPNGDPLLVSTNVGEGRVLVWLTGADVAATTLPAKPDYAPLMMNLTVYVAGDTGGHRNRRVGEMLVEAVDPTVLDHSTTVVRPDGTRVSLRPDSSTGRITASYLDTEQPGFYRFDLGNAARVFAVNIAPGNGDLRRADEAELKGTFGPGVTVIEPGQKGAEMAGLLPGREFTQLAMISLLIVLVLETLAATTVGRRR